MFQKLPPGANGQPVITINPNNGAPQSITINPAPNPGTVPTFGAPDAGHDRGASAATRHSRASWSGPRAGGA